MAEQRDEDKAWEDLVRRLGGSPEQAQSEPTAEPPHRADAPEPSSTRGPRDYTVAEEIVEDFQPPEPKPIATGNPRTVLSWIGVIGAIAIWLLAALLGIPLAWWMTTVTVVAFLAGALSLFFLLPRTREHRNPYNDGDYGDGAQL